VDVFQAIGAERLVTEEAREFLTHPGRSFSALRSGAFTLAPANGTRHAHFPGYKGRNDQCIGRMASDRPSVGRSFLCLADLLRRLPARTFS
jgi:hypothetical protein